MDHGLSKGVKPGFESEGQKNKTWFEKGYKTWVGIQLV